MGPRPGPVRFAALYGSGGSYSAGPLDVDRLDAPTKLQPSGCVHQLHAMQATGWSENSEVRVTGHEKRSIVAPSEPAEQEMQRDVHIGLLLFMVLPCCLAPVAPA